MYVGSENGSDSKPVCGQQTEKIFLRVFAIVSAVRPVPGIWIVNIFSRDYFSCVLQARDVGSSQNQIAAGLQHPSDFRQRMHRIGKQVLDDFAKEHDVKRVVVVGNVSASILNCLKVYSMISPVE